MQEDSMDAAICTGGPLSVIMQPTKRSWSGDWWEMGHDAWEVYMCVGWEVIME